MIPNVDLSEIVCTEDPAYKDLAHACYNDIIVFAQTVLPHYVFEEAHRKMLYAYTASTRKDKQLNLSPRDHGKSEMVAVGVAYNIIRDPRTTVCYITGDDDLAKRASRFIRDDLLGNETIRILFPDLFSWKQKDNGEFDRSWNGKSGEGTWEVDHPLRKEFKIANPTFTISTYRRPKTGFHFDLGILDDIVTEGNYDSDIEKAKIMKCYRGVASQLGVNSELRVVGTRYAGDDLYKTLIEEEMEIIDPETMEVIGHEKTFDVILNKVEQDGKFLFPKRFVEAIGKYVGYDVRSLAAKKASYKSNLQFFYAQYYNEPNHATSNRMSKENIRYYSMDDVDRCQDLWYITVGKEQRVLNVLAFADLAYTVSKKSDYTAITVLGMDSKKNLYFLDFLRFKTDIIIGFDDRKGYVDYIAELHDKWNFSTLGIEAVSAANVIVNAIKDALWDQGRDLRVIKGKPSSRQSKDARIIETLETFYNNQRAYHPKDHPLISLYEHELVHARPKHDDIKDSAAGGAELIKPSIYDTPPFKNTRNNTHESISYQQSLFGGV